MHDLSFLNWIILLAAVFAVAFFYSSVGHGGATGYLAALALLGVAPASAKVAVLITNVLVAGVAWWRFWKAGHFDTRVLLIFAVASVPCAWLGSRIHVSPHTYKLILAWCCRSVELLCCCVPAGKRMTWSCEKSIGRRLC
ncbi:MAG: sulfite exporter TauE/SafE family protein [Limisphaerales bacterium]